MRPPVAPSGSAPTLYMSRATPAALGVVEVTTAPTATAAVTAITATAKTAVATTAKVTGTHNNQIIVAAEKRAVATMAMVAVAATTINYKLERWWQ